MANERRLTGPKQAATRLQTLWSGILPYASLAAPVQPMVPAASVCAAPVDSAIGYYGA